MENSFFEIVRYNRKPQSKSSKTAKIVSSPVLDNKGLAVDFLPKNTKLFIQILRA